MTDEYIFKRYVIEYGISPALRLIIDTAKEENDKNPEYYSMILIGDLLATLWHYEGRYSGDPKTHE